MKINSFMQYLRISCILWLLFLFQESDRIVTKKEGINFAREYGCLFTECSAKTQVNVQQCFEELVLKVWRMINLFYLVLFKKNRSWEACLCYLWFVIGQCRVYLQVCMVPRYLKHIPDWKTEYIYIYNFFFFLKKRINKKFFLYV